MINKIYILKGLPASGKSIWARSQPNAFVINKDTIRKELLGAHGVWSKAIEAQVIDIQRHQIQNAKNSYAETLIIDDTNLNPNTCNKVYNFLMSVYPGVEIEVKIFNKDPQKCIEDNYGPNRVPVPEKVIWDMYYKYMHFPEIIRRDANLQDAYIVDIDGTIANKSPDRGYYEWDKVWLDFPIKEVIEVIQNLPKIVFMSGRDECCRNQTVKWLKSNVKFRFPQDIELYMRPASNHEPDDVVKRKLHDTYILNKYNVMGVFDDRPKVVRMWQSLGYKVFNMGLWGYEF